MEIIENVSSELLEYMKRILVRERERVHKHIKINSDNECWEWTATLTPSGYGQGYDRYTITNCTVQFAHRIVYKLYKGDIPKDLDLDHLCKNRKCVNPEHLQPITKKDHRKRTWEQRKKNPPMFCKHGHPLSGSNLYIYKRPNNPEFQMRSCKACHLVRSQKYWKTKDKRNPQIIKEMDMAKSKAVPR